MSVNPWLAKKLEGLHSPPTVGLLVEVDDITRLEEVRGLLSALPGVSVGRAAFNMLNVTAPPAVVQAIGAIPHVTVHYNAPMGVKWLGLPDPPFISDPLVGQFRLSAVTVPFTPQQMAASFGPQLAVGAASFPFRMAAQLLRVKTPLAELHDPDVVIIPTGDVRKLLELPSYNKTTKTKVAVLDTGLSPLHPLLHPTKGLMPIQSVVASVPWDVMGHSTWVTTAGFGDSFWTRFGECQGVADPENGTLGSWKVTNDMGFGDVASTIAGIEAAHKWGAKIINLSLGGELQGSVEDDPVCRVIKQLKDEIIFVCAAGNDGPDPWTISNPGASPHVITVGSWSTYYNGLSFFSARGPNGRWYVTRGGRSHRDFVTYGDNMVKPDVLAPGGGPVIDGDPMDVLFSGVVGYLDGLYDYSPLDMFGALRGTSMACPLAAGVIALAVENGLVKTASDVKKKMARFGRKDTGVGYGIITYKKLR